MAATSRIQSHLRYPLTSILGSAGNVRILRALATHRSPRSALQISAETGLTPQGVRLVLSSLAQQRILLVHGSGRAQLHALNRTHPLADAVSALFFEEQRHGDALFESIREVLARRGTAVTAAWLYGSVARGEDSPASDIDIAVLVRSQAVADRIREELAPLEDADLVRISLTALTPKELLALPENDPWWSDVVRDGRVLKGAAPAQARQRLNALAA